MNIVTDGLAAAVDREEMSSRNDTYIVASLRHDVADVNINRMSFHRQRERYRVPFFKNLKEELILDVPSCRSLGVNLIDDLMTEEYVDRLMIVVSGERVSQLLGLPNITSRTGQAHASISFLPCGRQDGHLGSIPPSSSW